MDDPEVKITTVNSIYSAFLAIADSPREQPEKSRLYDAAFEKIEGLLAIHPGKVAQQLRGVLQPLSAGHPDSEGHRRVNILAQRLGRESNGVDLLTRSRLLVDAARYPIAGMGCMVTDWDRCVRQAVGNPVTSAAIISYAVANSPAGTFLRTRANWRRTAQMEKAERTARQARKPARPPVTVEAIDKGRRGALATAVVALAGALGGFGLYRRTQKLEQGQ